MPAAAVIPAPIAYIKVVAVKKLVVETVSRTAGSSLAVFNWRVAGRPVGGRSYPSGARGPVRSRLARLRIPSRCSLLSVEVGRYVYFEQIRVLKAGQFCLNIVCME